uniref:Uncharacterized protein n=1 Tax=Oryza brachyantha TaxID=4533 RepID=J3MVE5_ORYBR
METRAEKAARAGGRWPARAAAGRRRERRRREGSRARERLARAAGESQGSGRGKASAVDQRRPRHRHSGVDAVQVESCALAPWPWSAGLTRSRRSATSELAADGDAITPAPAERVTTTMRKKQRGTIILICTQTQGEVGLLHFAATATINDSHSILE